ncbi:MAG: hypothetical protein K0Q94_4574 [Paenibacillus sp.]|nr:hypothetical protein [Paenibacillus sp.]
MLPSSSFVRFGPNTSSLLKAVLPLNLFRHYSILWVCFIVLFSAATFGMELLEGYKIMTTEYMGIRNVGPILTALFCIIAAVGYPLSLMLVSMLIRKTVKVALVRAFVYTLIGAVGGIWIFDAFYPAEFVQRYDLNRSIAIVFFGTAGLLYAWIDNVLAKKLR